MSLHSGAQICRMALEGEQKALNSGNAGSTQALPASGSGLVSQASVCTTTEEPNRGPTLQDEAVTPTKRFPGWLWSDVIPLSGVTAIVGGAAYSSGCDKSRCNSLSR